MYLVGLKTADMSEVEFEGVPSSRGLQGSNRTEVLFGCCWFNLHLCSFYLSPQLFGKRTQLTLSGCKNEGCLFKLNSLKSCYYNCFPNQNIFASLNFVNLDFRHKEQNFFHPRKRHVNQTIHN